MGARRWCKVRKWKWSLLADSTYFGGFTAWKTHLTAPGLVDAVASVELCKSLRDSDSGSMRLRV